MLYTVAVRTYHVSLDWDNEANVWVATSPDIIGLVLESESYDTLIKRVRLAAPELLALNNQPNSDVRIRVVSQQELVAA